LAEGGRARISGFSARPSSIVGKGGRAVSVGVSAMGAAVVVAVARARLMRGKLQFARIKVLDMSIINRRYVRFTCGLLRL